MALPGKVNPDAPFRVITEAMKGAGVRGGACSGSRRVPLRLAASGSRG
jgi:hypothetical protein